MPAEHIRVAVVGLGVAGLAATKNLLEAGLQVTAFERNEYVGGLWKFNDSPDQLSVLKSTHPNGSKHFLAYSDFPLPADTPTYPSASVIHEWLNDYAKYFDLADHFRLGTTISRIDQVDHKFELHWSKGTEEHRERFDRVLITTGPFQRPRWPSIDGLDSSHPKVLHGHAYKTPEPFRGKSVVVLGSGNSACDICTELIGVAGKVYVSVRSGNRIFKVTEPPIDRIFTRRLFYKGGSVENTEYESQARATAAAGMDAAFKKHWPDYDLESLRMLPAPSNVHSIPGLNPHFIPALASGEITPIAGVKSIVPGKIITAEDVEISCDYVICATGGTFDYSILSPSIDPTNSKTSAWDECPRAEGLKIPRLYQGIFHPDVPGLAFIGPYESPSLANPADYDLMSSAIAQIWAENHSLPSKDDMAAWCDKCYEYQLKLVAEHKLPRPRLWKSELERWLNNAAGNGMNEAFANPDSALHQTDPELWDLCMDGVPNPYVYRLLPGREGARKAWPGARDAIFWANGQGTPPVI
ncbi:flavin monooxygenase-like protein [Kockovaella imperatae]|uniref:Flavin monooxygenase-like protein n=1 Tax=Kockovaella imperatae TaxID=4999 RepID=A0A1Y1UQ60_9TREE|nr:flavin monooxygenase-like protein [Kockovaella imperatae]ORX40163.1 flavin monooxygenase-like protein [Kockovaella imperatae]